MTTASALQALEATKGIEPIVAWRTWALTGHRDGTSLLLRPVAGRSRPWRPMQIAEAGCKHTRLHASPSLECTCGLHGTHGLDLLRRTRCPAVLGRVALWGRVIEHDLGYRAQYAYPQLVTLICQFCFWQWGSHGMRPDIVGWFHRDELVPLVLGPPGAGAAIRDGTEAIAARRRDRSATAGDLRGRPVDQLVRPGVSPTDRTSCLRLLAPTGRGGRSPLG